MTAGPVHVHDRYRLGRTLGAGGMGRVWQARDEILDRDVALKEILLPPELLDADQEALRRHTLREGRAAARLSHPGVAQVYDAFESDGRAWIVMEYVPSRSLQEVLDAEGPLPPRRVAEIGLAVLDALKTAHAAGVRHRDVKPANVLLATDGRVVLTDFGVAAVDGESLVTSSGLVMGSPRYMAPERVRDGETSAAGDLWSLGATLYAAVEGRPPYAGRSVMETITAVVAEEPRPAQQAGELLPVLEGLLRKSPKERIDAEEAEKRLRVALEAPMEAPPAPDPSPAAAPSPAPPPVTAPPVSDRSPAPPVSDRSPAPPVSDRSPAPPVSDRSPEVARPPASHPQAAPPVSPAPLAARRRRLMRALIAAGIVLLLVAAGVTWWALRSDADKPTADPPASAPPVTSAAPSAESSSAPSSATSAAAPATVNATSAAASGSGGERPALPAGWNLYRDPTGFSLYVPTGWKRSKEHGMVYFRGAGRVLGIDQTKQPQWNPVADWRGKADYRVARGDFPGYHEIHIREVGYFRKAADWEFTFDRSGVRQHVNNRGVVTSAHQAYGIYWQTSDAEWAAAQKDLRLVFASFRPAA
ncbi:protein kinase domain-containing protein [Actinoplanes sp. CA-142083]|uniref:serine/threonine-protein kinase n=1 Tax=Actinoplanes sp. CA-142083 TaxID=3239903 RepID=UPI003D94AD39